MSLCVDAFLEKWIFEGDSVAQLIYVQKYNGYWRVSLEMYGSQREGERKEETLQAV